MSCAECARPRAAISPCNSSGPFTRCVAAFDLATGAGPRGSLPIAERLRADVVRAASQAVRPSGAGLDAAFRVLVSATFSARTAAGRAVYDLHGARAAAAPWHSAAGGGARRLAHLGGVQGHPVWQPEWPPGKRRPRHQSFLGSKLGVMPRK